MVQILPKWAFCFFAWSLSFGADGKTNLSPRQVKAYKSNIASYRDCKIQVVKKIREAELSKRELSRELKICRDRFPAVALLQSCKKTAVKPGGYAVAEAVKQCQENAVKMLFDQKSLSPFGVKSGAVFFAGVGLNQPHKGNLLSLPHFDCSDLSDPKVEPGYLLFGDSVENFAQDSASGGLDIVNHLKSLVKNRKSLVVSGLGEVVQFTNRQLLYLPTKSCEYSEDVGKRLKALNLYFLTDDKAKISSPFFGVVFYAEGSGRPKLVSVASEIRSQGAKLVESASPQSGKIFFGDAPITEFDEEGDPSNLCRRPRKLHWLSAVIADSRYPDLAQSSLIANIDNLCRFGDMQVANFVAVASQIGRGKKR